MATRKSPAYCLGVVFASVIFQCGAVDLAAPCETTGSGNCARLDQRGDKSMLLLQVTDAEQTLLHRARPPSLILASVDSKCASLMRESLRNPAVVGQSLLLGAEAIQTIVSALAQNPPDIAGGTAALATKLFDAIEHMLPENVTTGHDLAEFRDVWMDTFAKLPSLVQSVTQDIQAFKTEGDPGNLMNAVQTILTNASVTLEGFVPEEVGVEIARYLEAIIDVTDGLGNGLGAFARGDAAGAVESIYNGVRAGVNDLVPPEIQNDATYQQIVGLLDVVIGNISTHVLDYKRALANSNVCWRGYERREYERPSVCPVDYVWDGEQWCLYREVEPYTLESVSHEWRYLNVNRGSSEKGTNVGAWNNPDSGDTQWRIQGPAADGSYTFQNVAGGLYLNVEGGVKEHGTNVQVWDNPHSAQSQWFLRPVGPEGIFTIENVHTGTYANLECYWCLGANVKMSTSSAATDNHWRIVSVWRKAPMQAASARKVALLDQSVAKKKPQGALPAVCTANLEKRGSWCYKACPPGYQPSGSRCKADCGSVYPIEAATMCGKHNGDVASAIQQMVIVTAVQLSKINMAINIGGVEAFTGTATALIEAGKPFAHPTCPVP